jgi:hypothetical protein
MNIADPVFSNGFIARYKYGVYKVTKEELKTLEEHFKVEMFDENYVDDITFSDPQLLCKVKIIEPIKIIISSEGGYAIGSTEVFKDVFEGYFVEIDDAWRKEHCPMRKVFNVRKLNMTDETVARFRDYELLDGVELTLRNTYGEIDEVKLAKTDNFQKVDTLSLPVLRHGANILLDFSEFPQIRHLILHKERISLICGTNSITELTVVFPLDSKLKAIFDFRNFPNVKTLHCEEITVYKILDYNLERVYCDELIGDAKLVSHVTIFIKGKRISNGDNASLLDFL